MNWNDLSRYRAPSMGFAMIIVMLFHVPLSRSDAFYGLMRCGNNGVDMFLFLSGIGLWYSWTKPSAESSFWEKLRKFYFRRFLRLYPAWLIIASLYYIPQYWPNGGGYSPNLFHLIANILVGWSFWRIDDLTFWFVPAIMALYLIAPFYMRLIQCDRIWRWLPLVTILWYLLVRDYPPLWKSVGYVEIFWSRIPVFLLGINAGEWVKNEAHPQPLPTSPKGRLLLKRTPLPLGGVGGGPRFPPLPLLLRLCGRASPWSLSSGSRADGLHPVGRQRNVPDVQGLQPCPFVAAPCFHLYRWHLPRNLSHPHSVCAGLCQALPLRLLAHLPADACLQHPPGLAAQQTRVTAHQAAEIETALCSYNFTIGFCNLENRLSANPFRKAFLFDLIIRKTCF